MQSCNFLTCHNTVYKSIERVIDPVLLLLLHIELLTLTINLCCSVWLFYLFIFVFSFHKKIHAAFQHHKYNITKSGRWIIKYKSISAARKCVRITHTPTAWMKLWHGTGPQSLLPPLRQYGCMAVVVLCTWSHFLSVSWLIPSFPAQGNRPLVYSYRAIVCRDDGARYLLLGSDYVLVWMWMGNKGILLVKALFVQSWKCFRTLWANWQYICKI